MASSSTSETAVVITRSRWATALASEAQSAEARHELAAAYWYTAYAFFRASNVPAEDAAGQVESLVGRFVATPLPPPVREPPVSFREHFLASARETLSEAEPAAPVLSIDRDWAEQRFAKEPARDAEAVFCRRWTLTILEFTLALLKSEYEAAGKAEYFTKLRSFLGYATSGEEAYHDVAETLRISESAARTSVFELRKRYREILHAQIADTVARDDLADAEHMTLLAAL